MSNDKKIMWEIKKWKFKVAIGYWLFPQIYKYLICYFIGHTINESNFFPQCKRCGKYGKIVDGKFVESKFINTRIEIKEFKNNQLVSTTINESWGE